MNVEHLFRQVYSSVKLVSLMKHITFSSWIICWLWIMCIKIGEKWKFFYFFPLKFLKVLKVRNFFFLIKFYYNYVCVPIDTVVKNKITSYLYYQLAVLSNIIIVMVWQLLEFIAAPYCRLVLLYSCWTSLFMII